MGETPDWSVSELAEKLNVSMVPVRRWINAGYLDAYQTPGGEWRVPSEAVARLRSQESQSTR